VNTAVNQVRNALGDAAANPTFIQTIPRRGYRFVAPVQWERESAGAAQLVGGAASEAVPERAVARSRILSDADDLPAVGSVAVKTLFSLIQVMYLAFYIVALARLAWLDVVLNELAQYSIVALVLLIATAVVGIPVRLFLLSAAVFNYAGLRKKFTTIFPGVLMLDEIWALGPFLLLPQIGLGLALACSAILLYVPFAQRSLLLMAKPEVSRS
jgi:cholera toxin transcriptional activator